MSVTSEAAGGLSCLAAYASASESESNESGDHAYARYKDGALGLRTPSDVGALSGDGKGDLLYPLQCAT